MRVTTTECVYDPEVVRTESGGYKTLKGTGVTLFLEYGKNDNGQQEFKRVLDSQKKIIGQFYTYKKRGFIGDTKYTDLDSWFKDINEVTGCRVF